jgi:hypothetical protein
LKYVRDPPSDYTHQIYNRFLKLVCRYR